MTRSTWLLVAITALALIGASWAASGWNARSNPTSAAPESRTAVAVPGSRWPKPVGDARSPSAPASGSLLSARSAILASLHLESVAHRLRPAGPRIAEAFGALRSRAAALFAMPATLCGNRPAALLWIPPAALALVLVLRRRTRRNRWPQRQRSVLKLARSGRDVPWIARELRVSQDLVRAVLRPRFERRPVPGKGLPDRKLRPAGRSR